MDNSTDNGNPFQGDGQSFPPGTNLTFLYQGFWSIQLDIVGFLAVLGEASVLANGQVAAMSRTCFLPRLLPAPQALIRTTRHERLSSHTGTVVGAHSGNIRRHVNHIPHILHQVAAHVAKPHSGASELGQYQVRVIEIRWAKHVPEKERDVRKASEKAAHRSKLTTARTRSTGPLAFLAYAGCLESIGLFALSVTQNDGMSVLAVILLSFCSTLVGLASHWTLRLPVRTEFREGIPPSDVIISYPNGSFLIVRCPEDIARLYFQSEECDYFVKGVWQYRIICLAASMCLMIGVITLANASPLLQVVWAAAYILLNAAYWIVAALPNRWHWDMTSFETSYEHYEWHKFIKEKVEGGDPIFHEKQLLGTDVGEKPTFTEALWKAIALTKNSHWARVAEVAPNTAGWDEWLKEASKESRGESGKADTSSGKTSPDLDLDDEEKGKPAAVINQRDSTCVDQESQTNSSGHPAEVKLLPRWNYNDALTKALAPRKRDSW